MPFAYRFADYVRYKEVVGAATYLDVTRRSDPARIPSVWDHVREIYHRDGPPWVVQIWTKDVGGVLHLGSALLGELTSAGTTLTAQVTITGLAGTPWEPKVPVEGWRYLPQLIRLLGGPEHITWRYDPIIPGVHTAERFALLAGQVADLDITRGVINFLAPPGRYRRADARIAALLPAWAEGMAGYDQAWRTSVARELVDIATEQGLSLACCAEYAALSEQVPELRPASCGDYDWFVALSGRDPGRVPYRGSRPGCGCAHYFDVGSYGMWSRCHRCVYCYAG
ncbi:MAG: DUF1848 family protein [Chloroflexi bacterium]|nr:DUF1848 family protein [Chloroflexota bacterium]